MRNASRVAASGTSTPPALDPNQLERVSRAEGRGLLLVQAASCALPPVMAMPSSSSETSGANSPTIRPS